MRRALMLLVFFVVSFFLTSCGGGGGGGSENNLPIDQTSLTVQPNQSQQTSLGQAKVTFPAGAVSVPTNVVLTEWKAGRIPQPAFSALYPKLVIDIDGNLNTPITVEYPGDISVSPVVVVLDGDKPIGNCQVTKTGGTYSFTVDGTKIQTGRTRGSSVSIAFLLGIAAKVNAPDTDYGFTEMYNNGPGRAIIFLHGMLQSAEDSRYGLLKAKVIGGYSQAYSFRYDYRDPEKAGKELAAAIKSKGFPDKSVDIIGYSMGGIVALWALGPGEATKPIRRAIFMSAPIEGCNWGLWGIYSLFAHDWILSSQAMALVMPEDKCLSQLMPGSTLLKTITQYNYKQLGNVDYYLFAGELDNVVYPDFARADHTDMGNLTNGRVVRDTLTGFGHFAMDSPEAIAAAYDKIKASSTGISISCSPDPADVSFMGCWYTGITITNDTNQVIKVNTTEFEEFDLRAWWQGNYWFDPDIGDNEYFPHQRHDLGDAVTIEPGGNYGISVGFWPDENWTTVQEAPQNLQARTVHIICQATGADGTAYKADYTLTMGYDGLVPATPNTRSPHGQLKTWGGITFHKK